ncbi:SDR family NAD(P)-dependent oxidoreductase [Zavarzinia sp. CC-PAN008]|uniref:SDR family NAD(P)-dependent oxidoreductase n=1 Tax=Zavarzinia sp. CC-PAN008 TaxID=3243332 RepID=UPI003F74A0A7
MDLKGITAIITGGASGLGEATAREFVKHGAKVVLFDLQKDKGEKLAAELGGVFCEVNVTDEASVDAGFKRARELAGQERVLVNCAGTGIAVKTASRDKATGEIVPHPTDRFDRIIQINLVGTFRCIAKSAAGMIALDPVSEDGLRGVIINTGSVAAQDGQIGQAAYSASKNGVVGMTLPIARDLSRDGVRCCTILPGLFDTPLLAGAPENVRRALGAQVPFPARLGKPSEYAQLARQIVENDMLNGETIRLDGAIRMAPK